MAGPKRQIKEQAKASKKINSEGKANVGVVALPASAAISSALEGLGLNGLAKLALGRTSIWTLPFMLEGDTGHAPYTSESEDYVNPLSAGAEAGALISDVLTGSRGSAPDATMIRRPMAISRNAALPLEVEDTDEAASYVKLATKSGNGKKPRAKKKAATTTTTATVTVIPPTLPDNQPTDNQDNQRTGTQPTGTQPQNQGTGNQPQNQGTGNQGTGTGNQPTGNQPQNQGNGHMREIKESAKKTLRGIQKGYTKLGKAAVNSAIIAIGASPVVGGLIGGGYGLYKLFSDSGNSAMDDALKKEESKYEELLKAKEVAKMRARNDSLTNAINNPTENNSTSRDTSTISSNQQTTQEPIGDYVFTPELSTKKK